MQYLLRLNPDKFDCVECLYNRIYGKYSNIKLLIRFAENVIPSHFRGACELKF